ncbi:MAG: NRDE family protein [Planctomycetota bacterium]|jgi:hypothetical protein
MCLLITLVGVDPGHPIVVASNRDERRDRPSAPPGLFVGQKRRILSPRDREAGGTWIGVNDRGLFVGLTNLVGASRDLEGAPSRGRLPHLALDEDGVDAAADVVAAAAASARYRGFQLLVTDGRRARVLTHEAGGQIEDRVFGAGAIVLSNEHRPGTLHLPGLAAACAADLALDARWAALRAVLRDEGQVSGHRVLKRGGSYGTVSSSLIAVQPAEIRALVWDYAAGPPDEAPYRGYGNLARRLVEA